MNCPDNYLYTSPWFFLFLFTIVLLIVFIIAVEWHGFNSVAPIWIVVIFVFLILFLFISFILYYYHTKNYQCDVVYTLPQQIIPIQEIQVPIQYEECSVPLPIENKIIYNCNTSIPLSDLSPFK